MTALVRANAMRAADAVQTAEKIHLSNPLHIPGKLVDRFARIVTDEELGSRVAPVGLPTEALTRSGLGDFHHPAPPLIRLME